MLQVSIDNLTFSYGRDVILKDISLTAEAGDFVCLLGPSGCGKSTLLRLLAGLDVPAAGNIAIGGRRVAGPGLDRAIVFQDYSLFPWLSAGENIVLALRQAIPGRTAAEYRDRARAHLESVRLADHFEKLPSKLSGGMRQRAAIARAFALDSPVLLMDEPFGALDAVTRVRLQDLLLQLWQQEGGGAKTVFFVTHDVDEAIVLANTVIVLGTSPGMIKAIFRNDIPRPRNRRDLFRSSAFLELRNALVELLYNDDAVEA